jgi:formylmethanofuran dehydrogenase subunit A
MPTVLFINGWRFFFYANERDEPIHIHCRKAEKECKYWLDSENFDVKEAYTFKMNNKDKRQVKKMIFEYFEYIENEWNQFEERR